MRKDKRAPQTETPLAGGPMSPAVDPVDPVIAPPAAAPRADRPIAQPTSQPAPASQAEQPKSAQQVKAEKKAADPLRGSRASGFYASVAALGVLLVLLIIFIAQNTQKTKVNFLGWSNDNVSVAVALLVAAAAGLFVAVLASSLRILQLRRRVKSVQKAR